MSISIMKKCQESMLKGYYHLFDWLTESLK